MSWTDQRIDQLKTLWEKGLTASQIADELGGVSRNAVIGKAHRLGLKSRPSPVKANEPEKKVGLKKAPAKPVAAATQPQPVNSAMPVTPTMIVSIICASPMVVIPFARRFAWLAKPRFAVAWRA